MWKTPDKSDPQLRTYLGVVVPSLQLLDRVGNTGRKLRWLLIELVRIGVGNWVRGKRRHPGIGMVRSGNYLTVSDVAAPTSAVLSLRGG